MRSDAGTDEVIRRVVRAAREQLGLDVAFVSQFREGARHFLYVDTDVEGCPVEVGGSDPLEESYCHYVANGELPELVVDPASHPVASRLPVTHDLPVGTHLSVPIVFSDGSVFGTFCCFGLQVSDWFDNRDLVALRLLAQLVGEYLEERESTRRAEADRREAIRAAVFDGGLRVAFQPVVRLTTGEVVGLEALSRFPGLEWTPAEVFEQARALGIGPEVEAAAVVAALAELPRLPADLDVALNVSPGALATDEVRRALRAGPVSRLVVEVTEVAAVDDYGTLRAAVDELTGRGARLAIDDVGIGFSGLHHILRLSPQVLKVDAAIVRGVDGDTSKQAFVSSLVTFAACTGASVVAEGVETAAEAEALRALGVGYGQGYHFGRPAPLAPQA